MTARSLPAMPESLTHESASLFVQECVKAVRLSAPNPDTPWTLNASSLTHFDSAALASLLAVHRRVRSRGERLQLVALPERLQDLATLYGVRDLLPA